MAQSLRASTSPSFLALPHLNLKTIWKRTAGQRKRNGLQWALLYHGFEFEVQVHRGVDDARNMARVFPFMDWALGDAVQVKDYWH